MELSSQTYRLKSLYLIGFSVLLAIAAVVPTALADYTADFVVSAYYSPLPGQGRYATGSYDGDIRLNGGGVTTASGWKVLEAEGCFVAAPPQFPFGTVMEIDGIGTCLVLDRGGAIKNSRLDLHVGHGEEALIAALQWGKRTVSVNVKGIDFDSFRTAAVGGSGGGLAFYQKDLPQDPLTFVRDLEFGDQGEDVARLQQFLKDLGYFSSEVDGLYGDSTVAAVENFQLDQGMLDSEFDQTGKFGGFSIGKLRAAIAYNRDEYLEFVPSRNLGRGAQGDDVKTLQGLLVRLGYLNGVTGTYDAETVNAVMSFQLTEGVILDQDDPGAGYFGPNTQLALDKLLYMIENDVKVSSAKETTEEVQVVEDTSFTYLQSSEMLTEAMSEGDSGDEIRRLQETLRSLGFLRIEPTGYYGPVTTNAVYKFQQKVGLVDDLSDTSAGYVGPETRKALNGFLNSRNKLATDVREQTLLASGQLSSTAGFSSELTPGDRGISVKQLQQFLKSHGYFNGTFTTEYFGEVTKDALIAFQVDNNLIDGGSHPNAGRLVGDTLGLVNARL